MADSNTTTYSFTLPEVGASADSWGTKLNANWDKVDDLLDGSIAVNGITVTGGSIDGTPVGATTPSTGEFTTVTTTGNVDVTGTVTADGLTVETAAGTSGTIGLLRNSSSALAGNSAYLDFKFDNTFSGNNVDVQIGAIKTNAGNEESAFVIKTTEGTGTPTERFRVEANGDVSFYEDTGTTAKMVWDASAESLNLGGIATTNTAGFSQNIAIKDQYPSLSLEDTSTGTAKFTIGATDGSLGIWDSTASAYRMFINSSGNVGIANSAPVTRLDIDGFITLRNSAYPSPTSGVFKDGFIGSNDGTLTYAVNGASNGAYGSHKFQVRKGDSSDAIDAMTIDSSGNVGIGTASPASKLELSGIGTGVWLTLDRQDTNTNIIDFTETGTRLGYVGYVGDNLIINNAKTSSTTFNIANAEKMRLDSSGKLLVGTTSGAGRFNIAQSGNLWAQTINHSNATQFFIDFQQNGSQVGSITGNGTNASYNTISDERLKENIKDTTHVVNIDDIRVREYDWKVDGSHQRFGFIAQELEAVYPEAVTSPEDENEMKSVDYSKLVPLLVKEIQTLKARMETLENK
jgi:hypothetical protein